VTNLLILIGAYVVFFNLIGAALWWAHLRFWKRLSVDLPYEAVEQLVMPDGGTIELRRVGRSRLSGAEGESSDVPVLMVHGLAMNHRNHDTAEEVSLARYLRSQGRDVWLLTLRSGRPSRSLKRPLELVYGPAQSDFAAMVKHDLPSAVREVLARTGQPRLDFAVFSMGGMLLYAGLDRTVDSKLVRRAALFASPAKVRPLGALSLTRFVPAALAPSVPMVLMTRSFAFFPRLVPSFLWRRLYNPSNVDAKVERGMLWDVWEDIPGRLGNDFVRWSAAGGQLTVDDKPVLPGLANVNVPACFFAGSIDWLAPASTVHAGFEAWGRNVPHLNKHFVVLGRASGTRDEYGHCDISFGRHVKHEVFEPAARFLATGVFASSLEALGSPAGERTFVAERPPLDAEFETAQVSPAE
jgi:pimeloyl-ACP methyl ester carboxylesterase